VCEQAAKGLRLPRPNVSHDTSSRATGSRAGKSPNAKSLGRRARRAAGPEAVDPLSSIIWLDAFAIARARSNSRHRGRYPTVVDRATTATLRGVRGTDTWTARAVLTIDCIRWCYTDTYVVATLLPVVSKRSGWTHFIISEQVTFSRGSPEDEVLAEAGWADAVKRSGMPELKNAVAAAAITQCILNTQHSNVSKCIFRPRRRVQNTQERGAQDVRRVDCWNAAVA
jgi:hypothetical protein